jgi:hypothetical protein
MYNRVTSEDEEKRKMDLANTIAKQLLDLANTIGKQLLDFPIPERHDIFVRVCMVLEDTYKVEVCKSQKDLEESSQYLAYIKQLSFTDASLKPKQ